MYAKFPCKRRRNDGLERQSGQRYKYHSIWQQQSWLSRSTSIFNVFSWYLTNPLKSPSLNGKIHLKSKGRAVFGIISQHVFWSTQSNIPLAWPWKRRAGVYKPSNSKTTLNTAKRSTPSWNSHRQEELCDMFTSQRKRLRTGYIRRKDIHLFRYSWRKILTQESFAVWSQHTRIFTARTFWKYGK